jgi:hypothetical protein
MILGRPLRELPASLWAQITDASKAERNIAEYMATIDNSVCLEGYAKLIFKSKSSDKAEATIKEGLLVSGPQR